MAHRSGASDETGEVTEFSCGTLEVPDLGGILLRVTLMLLIMIRLAKSRRGLRAAILFMPPQASGQFEMFILRDEMQKG